jgi:hypothetical protein
MKQFIHNIYLACWDSYQCETIKFDMCSTMLSNVMRTHEWSWKVIGITPNALAVYKHDEWRHKSGNNIQRAHLTDRKDMVRWVIKRDTPMSKDELLNYWIWADRTILATKSENSNRLPNTWHKIDAEGLFRDKGTGFRFTIGEEGEFLKQLSTCN